MSYETLLTQVNVLYVKCQMQIIRSKDETLVFSQIILI